MANASFLLLFSDTGWQFLQDCRSSILDFKPKPPSFKCTVTVTTKCKSDVLFSFGDPAKKHASQLACKRNAVSTITLKHDALKNLLDCEVSLLKCAKNVVKHLALDLVGDAKEGVVVNVLCSPVLL